MKPDRRVLFLQVTDPANYPPIIHASQHFADAGWSVTLLSAPIGGSALAMPSDARIELRAIRERPSHVVGGGDYARYLSAATGLALRLRPSVIYASDPLAAGPALAAAAAGARLVYHEHDSPRRGALRPWIAWLRRRAARKAEVVVLPNASRAAALGEELGVAGKVATVWNLPSRRELPRLACRAADRLELYYHGSITPDRLPEAVVRAVARLGGRAHLSIAGYEAPGAKGYVGRLLELGAAAPGAPTAAYLGEIPQRDDLLARAAKADVGLVFMPLATDDPNMRHMVGASNKAFDYLAAGQALLVSDRPDWRAAFVEPGYGRACDPTDSDALTEAFGWFADHPQQRRAMGRGGRARIEQDWNYDTAFAPILARLETRRGT